MRRFASDVIVFAAFAYAWQLLTLASRAASSVLYWRRYRHTLDPNAIARLAQEMFR